MLYEDCGEWEMKKAPKILDNMKYNLDSNNREIRIYKNINSRFILEDLYSKLMLNENNKD